jgi:hypothetical protein
MTARAKAALDAAEAAIVAGDDESIELAEANFDLFDATIAEYKDSLVDAAGDATKEAKIYEAYVLLDERKDMALNDAIAIEVQLADELAIVFATFAAVLK